MDQPKIERLLRLMLLMSDKSRLYSVIELATMLDISERSIYRYIDTFESAGFIVKKVNGKVWLARESDMFKSISELVYFTTEEAQIIKDLIDSLDSADYFINGIKNKLYSIYDFKKIVDFKVDKKYSKKVKTIIDSISNKTVVCFKNYRSSNSGVIKDRLVEPIEFTQNMKEILCYEVETGLCKFFKVSRIEEVQQSINSWSYEHLHKNIGRDPFGFAGIDKLPVSIELSMLAANLLIEEFPNTFEKVEKISSNRYRYSDIVYNYEGICRFVLGLCNEVKIIESKEFIDFVNKKRERSLI